MLHPAILDLVRRIEGTLGKIYLFCGITSQTLSEKGVSLPEDSLAEILLKDLVVYSCYLSASDGDISDAEIECMKRLFSLKWSRAKIEQFANESLSGIDFSSTVPKTLAFFEKADQLEIEEDGSIETYSCEFLFDCFKAIGRVFVLCDGCSNANKEAAMTAYLSNLKTNINKAFPTLQIEE